MRFYQGQLVQLVSDPSFVVLVTVGQDYDKDTFQGVVVVGNNTYKTGFHATNWLVGGYRPANHLTLSVS